MRFVYCHFMKDEPERVQEAAPKHAASWRSLDLSERFGGRFEDRTGGLISFDAPARKAAEELVAGARRSARQASALSRGPHQ
jgi:hypothetical protein